VGTAGVPKNMRSYRRAGQFTGPGFFSTEVCLTRVLKQDAPERHGSGKATHHLKRI
jgi:hypothetical protein